MDTLPLSSICIDGIFSAALTGQALNKLSGSKSNNYGAVIDTSRCWHQATNTYAPYRNNYTTTTNTIPLLTTTPSQRSQPLVETLFEL